MCISPFGPSSSFSNSLVILFIHSACPLYFLVAIFLSKIVRFLLHPVVGMFSRHVLLFVGRIFFRCLLMSCFVCIVLPFVDIFSSSFFRQYVLVYFFKLYCYFPQVVSFFLFQHVQAYFCFIILDCVSSRISHSGFDFFFVLFESIPMFSQTNFDLA